MSEADDAEAQAVLDALAGVSDCSAGCGVRVSRPGLCINCWLEARKSDDWYADNYFKKGGSWEWYPD